MIISKSTYLQSTQCQHHTGKTLESESENGLKHDLNLNYSAHRYTQSNEHSHKHCTTQYIILSVCC